jgi:hypothetical protein
MKSSRRIFSPLLYLGARNKQLENVDYPHPLTGKVIDLDFKELEMRVLESYSNKYPDSIMKTLRRCFGVSEEDNSRDDEINLLSNDEVFHRLLVWEGIIGYTVAILTWINQIYGINLTQANLLREKVKKLNNSLLSDSSADLVELQFKEIKSIIGG